MDGEMDWIAARFVLSAIMGVHPLVAVDDAGADDEHFPVDDAAAVHGLASPPPVALPAAVLAPEEVAGAVVCAVCTEEVAARQAVVRLPCAHWYHAGCIGPWLRIRTNCPTCRAELPRSPPPPTGVSAAPGGGGDSRQPPAAGGVVYDARRHVAQLINHHRSID